MYAHKRRYDYVFQLTEEETKRKENAEEMRRIAISRINEREDDLERIKRGDPVSLKSQQKPRTKMKSRVFRKYMDLFYDRPVKVNVVCLCRFLDVSVFKREA